MALTSLEAIEFGMKATITCISLGWVGNWNYFTSGIHSDQEAKSDFSKNYRFLRYTQTLNWIRDGNYFSPAPLYKMNNYPQKFKIGQHFESKALTSDNRKPWIDKVTIKC